VSEPTYTRLPVDERRRQLLELGADLFVRHDYGELSMARIAREAGISKALLYHYYPSKREFFRATLALAAQELRELTEPDPTLAPLEALRASLDA
jgi:AcrR family transcriptional regulator